MDAHHVLANLSVGFTTDTTAFSALPNAPVLADRPTRRERLAMAWRARRSGSVHTAALQRPMRVMGEIPATIATQPADPCRMVA
jgi:hypothetical protein